MNLYLILGVLIALVLAPFVAPVVSLLVSRRFREVPVEDLYEYTGREFVSRRALAASRWKNGLGQDDSLPTPPADENRVMRRFRRKFQFDYTIREEDGQFTHIVTTRRVARKPDRDQFLCMVIVMQIFSEQLKIIGADLGNVPFKFDDSGARIQTVKITLSPEENAKMLAEPMTVTSGTA